MVTSRNAKGIDIIAYNQNATKTRTIQVKALSKRDPVPFGSNLDNLIADYFIVCRNVFSEEPEIFIAKANEIKDRIHEGVKEGRKSYWLHSKDHEIFRDKWNKIGDG